jgi:hypothetical protein
MHAVSCPIKEQVKIVIKILVRERDILRPFGRHIPKNRLLQVLLIPSQGYFAM